jgi:chemotaxis methyl-accepting protein methylase
MLKVRSTGEARELLQKRPALLPAAVNALLIGVTGFFRDPPVFEEMRSVVLPRLALRGGPLRVWSAACSTGEELCSVAILLAEEGLLARSHLLGTDYRSEAIERARSGLYSEAPADPAIRRKYFEPVGKCWRVSGPLRWQMRWQVADLAETAANGPWDIILWRNLAIYLNPDPAERLWSRLAAALAPGGFLIVGKAERPPSGLDLEPVCRCIYRRRRSAGMQLLRKEYA